MYQPFQAFCPQPYLTPGVSQSTSSSSRYHQAGQFQQANLFNPTGQPVQPAGYGAMQHPYSNNHLTHTSTVSVESAPPEITESERNKFDSYQPSRTSVRKSRRDRRSLR
ncbi:hypothetical protein Pmar_PMAR007266 [Perkinsus marinus ATCC 50983]|uniref:Uncharacterized protein n=1 Tax=Perkinsus marinus (strain ATCC 50983 / TXsc) TaxID=423536 RepID=C5KNQ4_PERM5|nr:hypothetical protein Pmar_PMAR007266 [Perkinsus marinus ATCC 50983]EER13890.1 hypothetical protein Pmar_PMAR007266 [Perkinsus marinus ATCC 50983]|eukprot:XP_002782095.1 hypothetical protein Pmar_PMAR007266 [Perkinsus marinus ATCC 50983]